MAVLDLPNEKILEICDKMDDQTLGRFIQSNSRIYQVCWNIFEIRRKNKIPHHTVKLTLQDSRQFLLKIYDTNLIIIGKDYFPELWLNSIELDKRDAISFTEWEPHTEMNDWEVMDPGTKYRTLINKDDGIGVIIIQEPFRQYIKIIHHPVKGITVINTVWDNSPTAQHLIKMDYEIGYEILEIRNNTHEIFKKN